MRAREYVNRLQELKAERDDMIDNARIILEEMHADMIRVVQKRSNGKGAMTPRSILAVIEEGNAKYVAFARMVGWAPISIFHYGIVNNKAAIEIGVNPYQTQDI